MEQITLDLIPNGSLPVLHASQYDDGRQWKVNLTENGEDYTLSNETIVLDVRKGDGCAVTCAVAIESGKKYVILTSTEQMCAVAGQNLAELQITKDGAIIGTLNFVIMVERDPLDAGIGSESEIHDLQHQVDSCVHTAFETIGAAGLPYDNTESGLTADNVQAAIDEVNEKASGLPSDVYTKEETDALLADKADKATLEADYYDKAETDALLADKADASALGDYYTKSETDTKLSGKADKGSVYTKSQVNTLLGDKADKSDLDNFYTKSQTNSLLNVKANKADVYDKDYMDGIFEQIDNAFTGVNTALGQKANSADVYNKTYIDTALSAKANANAVYTKAETDAKIDGLIDDTTKASNKTWSSNKISEELEALLPVNSASGSIANFSTSLALPLVSLKASIVATESGSGTKSPQNPYTLGGFSNAVIYHRGKNLFNLAVADKKWVNSSNQIINGIENTKSNIIPCVEGATITISSQNDLGSNNFLLIATLDINGNVTSRSAKTSGTPASLTKTASGGDVAFLVSFYDYTLTGGGMVEVGSTATAYEAYNPNSATLTLALGQTVYGGEIVLTKKSSGYAVKLRVTHKEVNLGTLNWSLSSVSNKTFYGIISDVVKTNGTSICSIYTSGDYTAWSTQDNIINLNFNNNLSLARISDSRFIGYAREQIQSALSGVYAWCELATPIEIDLTDASDIVALVGTNNVWSDTGDSTVEYKQGIQEYIDAKLGNNNRGVNLLSLSAPADDLRRGEPDESLER